MLEIEDNKSFVENSMHRAATVAADGIWPFIFGAQRSPVPMQFYDAVSNFDRANPNEPSTQIIRRLLGMESLTEDEADFLLSYANAISLAKQLKQGDQTDEEWDALKLQTQEMYGIALTFGSNLLFARRGFISKIFGGLPKAEDASYVDRLIYQMDEAADKPGVQSRIILLAIPERL